jgi:ABC-type branched-subunit amino acid transport system substrate-binding protein
MHCKFRPIIAIFILFSLATVLLAGCAPTTTQPAAADDSKKPLKIGWLTDLTGPIASSCLPQMEAGTDVLNYINENGGVKGHPIEYVTIDTKYDNSLAVAGFEKIANQGDVFMVSASSVNFVAVCKPLAERYKIPLSGPSEYGTLLPYSDNPYMFGSGPTYADYYRSGFYWIKDNWKKSDPPKFALMGLDVAFSKACMKGVKFMLEKELKWPIVAEEWMTLGSTNATSQVTNIKNARPDYIVLCSTGVPQIVFHKTAYAMGLTENTVILDTFLSSIPSFRAADKKAMTGVINFIPTAVYPQFADSSPLLKTFYKIHNENHTGVAFDWVRISAMGNAWWSKIFYEKAIDKWGFKNLSGEKVKEGFETLMTGYDCDGVFSPCGFTPTEHMSGHDCNIVRTTDTYDVEVLQKWYKMPPWPSIAGDPNFWK